VVVIRAQVRAVWKDARRPQPRARSCGNTDRPWAVAVSATTTTAKILAEEAGVPLSEIEAEAHRKGYVL